MEMTQKRPLAGLLHTEAVRRRIMTAEQGLPDVPEMFVLVRDMTYSRPSARDFEVLIREWRGTCSGKHELLQALFKELGYRSTLIACTQEIQLPRGVKLPPELLSYIAEGPVVDVHNYLILHISNGDMIVDATWPLATSALGLPTNERFLWGENMQIACIPLEVFEIPENADPQAFKSALLREHYTPEQLARRENFITAVSQLFTGG